MLPIPQPIFDKLSSRKKRDLGVVIEKKLFSLAFIYKELTISSFLTEQQHHFPPFLAVQRTYRGNNLRTHPLMKLYLHPEENAVPDNLGSPDIGGASSQTNGEGQLFSPTTKRLLEEINDASLHEHETARQPSAVKRSLFHAVETGSSSALFENETNAGDTSILTAAVVVQPTKGTFVVTLPSTSTPVIGNENVGAPALESPVKKSKLKEKEN